jgi:hypothetical protein
VPFIWGGEVVNEKEIYKEKFPIYGGKCLSRKAVHTWMANKRFADEEVKTEVQKWLRQ